MFQHSRCALQQFDAAIIGVRHEVRTVRVIELLRTWASRPRYWFLPDDDWREQIQVAVKHLPPEQAEVVVLKIWEELTFAEIAEILGESPNTAASRYRYALEKLSHTLQPLAEEVQHG